MFSSDNRKKLLAPPGALSRVVFLNVADYPLLRYPPSQPQIPRGQWGNGAMEFFLADVKIYWRIAVISGKASLSPACV